MEELLYFSDFFVGRYGLFGRGESFPVDALDSLVTFMQVTNRLYHGYLLSNGSHIEIHFHFFVFDHLLHYMDFSLPGLGQCNLLVFSFELGV